MIHKSASWCLIGQTKYYCFESTVKLSELVDNMTDATNVYHTVKRHDRLVRLVRRLASVDWHEVCRQTCGPEAGKCVLRWSLLVDVWSGGWQVCIEMKSAGRRVVRRLASVSDVCRVTCLRSCWRWKQPLTTLIWMFVLSSKTPSCQRQTLPKIQLQ